MAILSVSDVKTYLGISGSGEDSFLTVALASAEAAIKSYTRRCIEQTTYTEYHHGNGLRVLYLRNTPVQSITSVSVDSVGYFGQGDSTPFGSDTLLTAGTDYALAIEGSQSAPTYSLSGALHRVGGVWPSSLQQRGLVNVHETPAGNVKVVCVAGWATVPADIKQAIYQYVAQIRVGRDTGGAMQSESFDYYSYTRVNPDAEARALGSLKSLLAPYRRLVL